MDELTRIRKYEELGNAHMSAADRCLRQFQLGNAPFLKFQDAISLWSSAGDCFCIAQAFDDAARAYTLAAEYRHHKVGRDVPSVEAAIFFVRSAEAKRRVDPSEAAAAYRQAIACYSGAGRSLTAANLSMCVAELLEELGGGGGGRSGGGGGDGRRSIAREAWGGRWSGGRGGGRRGRREEENELAIMECYQEASQFFLNENHHSQSCRCLLQVARRAALLGRFDLATESFEAVAMV